jgi:hypothetical protein
MTDSGYGYDGVIPLTFQGPGKLPRQPVPQAGR